MTKMTRRAALSTLAGGALVGGVCLAGIPGGLAKAEAAQAPYPWTYHKIDPKSVGDTAYWGYWEDGRGCCYGAFKAIIGTLAEKYGAPYNTFPLQVMSVGKSGIGGWGTICGALLGSALAMSFFYDKKDHIPLVNELFRWYETTAIPNFAPAKPKVPGQTEALVPGSVLCHVSASAWSHATSVPIHAKLRSERCARVTGEVAIKAIEILNAAHDNTLVFSGFGEDTKSCKSCHDKGLDSDYAKGNMSCTSCHDMGADHP